MSSIPKKSYSNPAFCQQSEFYKNKSPQRNHRQSPIGGQNGQHYEEQEFYEEMIVDDSGAVQDKKFVVVHNDDNRPKYRYEYIPLQESNEQIKRRVFHEEIEASTGRVHRYAVIPPEETFPPEEKPIYPVRSPEKPSRYATSTPQDIPRYPPPAQSPMKASPRYTYEDSRYPREELRYKPVPRYAVIPSDEEQQKTVPRYAVIPSEEDPQKRYALVPVEEINQRYNYVQPVISPQPRRANPVATQKLHELLTTPKKTPKKMMPISPIQKPQPRAQQKLNYTLATRNQEKRTTAIVAPICSSPVQSVYSETTFSKSSWPNLSSGQNSMQKTLAVAAFMMILCGGVTSSLCFYMISFMGRLYYLDFGVVSGFTCLLLGLLGFRSRNIYWLPNRNYISGYFLLSVFSLFTCAGLLVLLFVQPKAGSLLADMTSGAICGFSGLSLLLASSGVVASYCCRVPPPDNRVQHCAPGFTV